MRHFLFIVTLFCLAPVWAQHQQQSPTNVNVSGVVTGPDGAVAKVSVREIDSEHRIFSHTRADGNGLFSFRVRDLQHSLQFYAPGYRTFTHKMLGVATIWARLCGGRRGLRGCATRSMPSSCPSKWSGL